jgi:hypothetical protein
MSELAAYVDRMAGRLADLEREIRDLHPSLKDGRVRRDLEAALTAVKDRLKSLRLAGADLTDEMTQSFTQAFERLRVAVGEARSELAQA